MRPLVPVVLDQPNGLALPVLLVPVVLDKAVNRGDKRTRRVRDRDFMKFERTRRYRDRYRCQSCWGRARVLVFGDNPTPRT